jgi:hypothetical protein
VSTAAFAAGRFGDGRVFPFARCGKARVAAVLACGVVNRRHLAGGSPAEAKSIARRDACMRLRMARKLAAMQCDQ